ncbi:hypothetical protein AMJ85_11800 [candidate division BRC1 bacterium SM23_51]|nr:MAG: hypothetical protein AMJ85_11800 [candidate division BRC1 bacterium SM23_51]
MAAKIIIVEDNESVRSIVRMALELGQYEVIEAGDGKAGLQRLEEHPDCALVITDLVMPVMDGFELLRRIRDEKGKSDLPVFVLSAEKEATDALRHGATGVIRKPFSPIELLEVIRGALEPKS